MGAFQKLFTRLVYGGTTDLRPYESVVLNTFKESLPDEGAAILSRQLSHLDTIQRAPDGRLVTFFDTSDKTARTWSEDEFFPLRSEEISVARVWVRPAGHSSSPHIKADVVLHRGRLSSIEFSKAPEPLQKSRAEVVKSELLNNPMLPFEAACPPKSLAEIEPEFRARLAGLEVRDLCEPLPAPKRDQLIHSTDAKLPEDYLEMMSQTEGATINGWPLYGLSRIRKIIQPEGNYYVLAERVDNGAVGVAQDAYDGQLYLISSEGDKTQAVGSSLLAFIEKHSRGPSE